MTRVAIEIISGAAAGRTAEFELDAIRIGHAPTNDLVLEGDGIGAEHARVVLGVERVLLEDRPASSGTAVLRGGVRTALGETCPTLALESGDVIELGDTGDTGVSFCVRFELEAEQLEIVESRPLSTLGTEPGSPGEAAERLRKILAAQRALGASRDLESVVSALADAALDLVPGATHAT